MLKTIERFIKATWLDARVLATYGTRSPKRVRLPHSRHSLFVNPKDQRARKKLIRESVRGRLQRNSHFWRRACEQLSPGVILDIGLNYGECLFSCDYDPEVRLVGIEANQSLQRYIEKSKAAHPNGEQMEIYFALASDVHQQTQDFFVMPQWSGGSTALSKVTELVVADYEKVEVESVCVDEILASTLRNDQLLLFKIDVEGYEPEVMRGMEKSIHSVETAIGLIEFDSKLLNRLEGGASTFWEQLQQDFRVFAFTSHHAMTDVSGRSLASTKQLFGGEFHTDLLLVRSPKSAAMDDFCSQWLQTLERQVA